MMESGVPDFESTLWFAVFAPARIPSALVKKLNQDMVEVLQMPSFQSSMLSQGAEVAPCSPEQLTVFVKSEIVKWGEIIRAIGIKPQ